jgi:hypothetical protein
VAYYFCEQYEKCIDYAERAAKADASQSSWPFCMKGWADLQLAGGQAQRCFEQALA